LAWTTDDKDMEGAIRGLTRVDLVTGSLADTPAKVLEIAGSIGSNNPKLVVVANP
jgi:hypothetical protein